MKPIIEKILKSLAGVRVGIFVDDSNLYHAAQKHGWRLDIVRFKIFLSQYCTPQFIRYYMAIPANNDATFAGTESFLEKIKPYVMLRTKPLKYTPVGGRFVKKADVDVEITLDVIRTLDQLDVVIILSGYSDFLELQRYVVREHKKRMIFWAYEKSMAWELKYCHHLYLDDFKVDIALIK